MWSKPKKIVQKMAQVRSKQIQDFKSTVENWSALSNVEIVNASDIYALVSSGDLALSNSVDSLDLALSAEISATDSDVTAINESVDSLELALSAEISATDSDVTAINESVVSLDGRIDFFLSGVTDSTLDQLKEVTDYISSLDASQSGEILLNLTNNNASVDSLESALSAEISATDSDVTRIDGTVSTNKAHIDASVDSLESALSAEISATGSDVTSIDNRAISIESSIDSIETLLSGTSGNLDASVDSLEFALSAEISATDSDVTRIDGTVSTNKAHIDASVDSLESALSAEISATDSDVTAINESVVSLDGRIDFFLSGVTDSTLDQLKEVTDYIASLDASQSGEILLNLTNNNASVDSLESALSAEISATDSDVTRIDGTVSTNKAHIDASVDSLELALSAEISATDSDVTAINASIDSLESFLSNAGVTDDDFKIATVTGVTGASYVFTSEGTIASTSSVHVYINGIRYPHTINEAMTEVTVTPGFTLELTDSLVMYYVVE